MKMLKKEYILLLIITLFCLIFYFLFLGHYKLIDVDEPRYAEAAREMLTSGNWLTPYFNYEIRFDKPIFIYWLIALSYKIFGVTEFAARFPSAVSATLLVFFTYFFGRQTVSKTFGFISALILASMLEFIILGRMSITDMTLTFFICATLFAGILADFSANENAKKESFWDKNKDTIYWCLAYIFSGAAVLTKGPIGFILPAIVFAVYFILTGTLKRNLRFKYILPGFLLLLTVAVPWYFLIIKEHGMNFVNYFFLKHNLTRFGGGSLGHEQPFYFYPLVILFGTFPWSIYFVSALVKYTYNVIVKIKSIRFNNISVYKDVDNESKLVLFSFIWFFIVFLVFSISSAKLLTYILPLFPAVALLIGMVWTNYIEDNKNQKIINYSAMLNALISFLLSVATFASYFIIKTKDNTLELNNLHLMVPFVFFAFALALFILRKERLKTFYTHLIFMSCIILITILSVMPVVYKSAQIDLINYVNILKDYNSGDNVLVTLGMKKPSLVFYSQKKVEYVGLDELSDLDKYLKSDKPLFIVTKKKYLGDLSKDLKYNLISSGKRYSLISNIEKLKER